MTGGITIRNPMLRRPYVSMRASSSFRLLRCHGSQLQSAKSRSLNRHIRLPVGHAELTVRPSAVGWAAPEAYLRISDAFPSMKENLYVQ